MATWIPSEALVIYATVYGLFLTKAAAPENGDAVTAAIPIWQRWVTFAIATVVGLVLMAYHTNRRSRTLTRRKRWANPKLYISAGLMVVALAVYVTNMPGDPFTETFDIPAPWPAIAALVAAFFIPKIAAFFGVHEPN